MLILGIVLRILDDDAQENIVAIPAQRFPARPIPISLLLSSIPDFLY